MARLFELRSTPTDVVLRAMAIAAIVFNHAAKVELTGGMAFLVMLSGMNVARFAIKDGTETGIRRSIAKVARQIFLPSLVLVLLSFAVYQRFDLLELLFIRHNPQRISAFPVWFSNLILQLLASLYLLLSIPAVARAVVRRPAQAMLILFCASLLLRAIAPFVPSPVIFNHVLYTLWNFTLGAALYFLAVDATTSRRATRWLAAACVLVGAIVGHSPATARFWWLISSGLLLVSVRCIPLPHWLMRVTTAVSAATFGIFLTHEIWFKAVSRVNELWAGPDGIVHPLILFVLAILLGTVSWGAFMAFGRAYRAVQAVPARELLPQ